MTENQEFIFCKYILCTYGSIYAYKVKYGNFKVIIQTSQKY